MESTFNQFAFDLAKETAKKMLPNTRRRVIDENGNASNYLAANIGGYPEVLCDNESDVPNNTDFIPLATGKFLIVQN